MLIFSRDKNKIISTKNIIGLCIDTELYNSFSIAPPYEGTYYTIVAICDKKNIEIGRYETKERAEELMKALYHAYSEELRTNYETSFEMPKN